VAAHCGALQSTGVDSGVRSGAGDEHLRATAPRAELRSTSVGCVCNAGLLVVSAARAVHIGCAAAKVDGSAVGEIGQRATAAAACERAQNE
jgi:hypothetical protein